ncbi:leucine-rich repeat-containing protein 15-like isoform X1 [Anneissia japonica]|uniref:leucine-rich repeat-containing protein 15-like isoform X1 n=1 Tax=Anneissia japonica TaxID=1529436 RepID=UPI0014256CB9|nr:leucine-rich repeat-containing protein 15-like isoform X1 [Anneissia japonica]
MRCSNSDYLFVVVLFSYYIRNSRTVAEDICSRPKDCGICDTLICKGPDSCTCHYCGDCISMFVDCESKYLKKVPNLETNTKHLNLQNNYIAKLDKNSFSNVIALESLNLAKNKLVSTNINKEAFRGLDKLQCLSLAENNLKQIHIMWFADLRSLTTLMLQNLNLMNISEGVFTNSPNLEWISLGNNNIQSLPSTLFSKQTGLNQLELYNNLIKDIPDAFLETSKSSITDLFLHDNLIETINSSLGLQYLTNLTHLSVYRNPFKCNCDLVWFINWTQNNKKRFLFLYNTNITALCDNIDNTLGNLNLGDLHCNWIWWEVAVGVSLAILLAIFYLKLPFIRRCISDLIHKQHYIKLQSTAAAEERG